MGVVWKSRSAALSQSPGSVAVVSSSRPAGDTAQTRGGWLPLVESFRRGDVDSPSVTAPVVTKGTRHG